MTYTQARTALHRLTVRAIQPGLKRSKKLLHMLQHPQKAYPMIQITGTNGKGSVAAILSSVLLQAGLRVGRFTSPHLRDERERIAIQGKIITRAAFVRALERLLPGLRYLHQRKDPATTFEAWTVLAAEAFHQARVDMAVVEVGMGGRLDATTAWGNNVLSLLTQVQLEHTTQLGSTKLAICREKLGIARPGIPFLSAETDTQLRKHIKAQGRQKGFPVFFSGRQKKDDMRIQSWKKVSQGFLAAFHSVQQHYGPLCLPLAGTFQLDNAGLALLALEKIELSGMTITQTDIKKGFQSVHWPGRLEQVSKKPPVFLDGAHNPAALLAATEAWRCGRKKVVVITGMMSDKDVPAMCQQLLPIAEHIITVSPPDERAIPARELAEIFYKLGKKAVFTGNYSEALRQALFKSNSQLPILIIGSLYNIEPARRVLKKVGLGI
ncbi:bifunctional folylpolyglutamate synthase/dihydrofolate synthase [bacterium]|nr:bifunctional folylpolyglutamate synthase/dihydrofolate synthase [bacterium]